MAIKPDTAFVAGETCIYDENDPFLPHVAKLKILSRSVRNGVLTMRLKVVAVITPSKLFPKFNEPGFVFSVVKTANVKYFSGLWYLRETE